MDLIKLNIKGISYSQTQTGAYALILEEEFGDRKLPVIIGSFEAQAIALALEKDITPPRPLTHDLFVSFADHFQFKVKAVFIHKLVDGVFYSNILCQREFEEEKEIDSRTSDAIAIAIRFHSPIYVTKEVMEQAGIEIDVDNEDIKTEGETDSELTEIDSISGNSFENKKSKELHEMLNEALSDENYELAARLRDEIDKRGKN